MDKSTKKFYFIFAWLFISCATGTLYYSVSSLIFDHSADSVAWINYAIFAMGFFPAFFFVIKNPPHILKVLYSLIGAVLTYGIIRFGISYIPRFAQIRYLDDFILGIVFSAIFAMELMFMTYLHGKSKTYNFLFKNEKSFNNKDDYASWLREETVGTRKAKIIPGYLNQVTIIAMLLLIFTFVSLSKAPQGKVLHTIFFTGFALSALGIYMLLYQSQSILKWKIESYTIPKKIFKNWNTLIGLLLIPVIAIPLLLPWNFRVFNVQAVGDYLDNSLSGVTINLQDHRKSDSEMYPREIGDETTVETEDLRPVYTEQPVEGDENLGLKIFLYSIAGIIVLYIIFAIIGGILEHKYKYTMRTRFVQFFINRYKSLRGVIDAILTFVTLIGKFFLALLGLHRFKREEDGKTASPVAQSLFSLFKFDEKVTDEKKEEIRTIIKEFVSLIDVTSRYVTPYRFFYGPEEYVEILIKSLPDMEHYLRGIVRTFNESRYSLHILTSKQIDTFRDSVSYVIGKLSEVKQT
jgi:hypothetical protein